MPGSLNIKFILYTAFRLAPFIIVSFFTLSSILNQDLKGIIYLAGLLFTCFFAIIGGTLASDTPKTSPENEAVCNSLTLTDTGRLSNIPLGMVVFTYTFFYLVDIIAYYGLASANIPTLIIFPVLIIAEFLWNKVKYECVSFTQIIVAGVIGTVCGVVWAEIIRSTGAVQLQYFNGINNTQTCSRPGKQKFKCTINK